MNSNTIKAVVKKQFEGLNILSIEKKSFGIFVVKVSEERAKSVRIGFIMGETNFDKSENGVVLESKVNW
jgi:hypothetical protein